MAQYLTEQGYRVRRTLAHPALVSHALKSPRWRCTVSSGQKKQVLSTSTSRSLALRFMDARVLRTNTFECCPPA